MMRVPPMSDPLDTVEREIARERAHLDTWLAESYAGMEEQRYSGEMDAGYPGWAKVEAVLGRAFDQRVLQGLSHAALDSVLFFVSRSEEVGRIVSWLSSAPPFSRCGDLSYPDFVFLCEEALRCPDDTCDYQLASCYRKREALGERDIDVLRRFFEKRGSYTRRTVLHVFQHFGLPQVVELATKLWRADDCEFSKLSCLQALKAVPDARPIFETYLEEYRKAFDVDAEAYRRAQVRQLTARDAADGERGGGESGGR